MRTVKAVYSSRVRTRSALERLEMNDR